MHILNLVKADVTRLALLQYMHFALKIYIKRK
jgi:hypothetical protein